MRKLYFIVSLFFIIVGCDDILMVEDFSDETVSVLAPAEGATLTTTSVTFSWNGVVDAEQYRLEIATPSFENASQLVMDSIVMTTNFTSILEANDYQWRVRAENIGYATPYTTQSFRVDTSEQIDITNETVVLLAPADGVMFSTADTIQFTWDPVAGADTYTIQIASPDFGNAIAIMENETTTNSNYSVSSLESGDYEWRVKASNSNYDTDFTTQSFTVED